MRSRMGCSSPVLILKVLDMPDRNLTVDEQREIEGMLNEASKSFPSGGPVKPVTVKNLRVTCQHFTAGATFVKRGERWEISECAPIIAWMRRTPFDRIRHELEKRGCTWEWS